MRHRKFRAYDNKAKQWLCGYPELGGFSLLGEVMLMGEWSAIVNRFIVSQRDRTPADLVIEDYTGLRDKKGTEVYQGDILRSRYSWDGDLREPRRWDFVVEFQSGCFGIRGAIPSFHHPDDVEFRPFFQDGEEPDMSAKTVVGNIHDNPELLQP
jgi:uncharacterized phage protein (TIGR01671 family)